MLPGEGIPMSYIPDDVNSWGGFSPLIITHDVGRSRDRSTAVVGGNSPYGQRLLGIASAEELPEGLFGTERAQALAAVDRRHYHNGLIVADLSNDATYGEILVQAFGRRVIGLQISRYGDGTECLQRATHYGPLPVYTIGRTYLIELLHSEYQSDRIRYGNDQNITRGFQQLANLSVELRDSGMIYTCPPGQHDDLGISIAMLAWAAQHPHLSYWQRNYEAARRPRRPARKVNWDAWT
jgi:hypothetical protein